MPQFKSPSESLDDLPVPHFKSPTESLDQLEQAPPLPTGAGLPPHVFNRADLTSFGAGLLAPALLPPPLNMPVPGNFVRAGVAGAASGLGHLAGATSQDLQDNTLSWDRVKQHLADALATGTTVGGLEYAMPYAGIAAESAGKGAFTKAMGWLGNKLSPSSIEQGLPQQVESTERMLHRGYNLTNAPTQDRTGLLLSQRTLDADEGSGARFLEGFASGAIAGNRIEPALKGQQTALGAVLGEEKARVAGKVAQIGGPQGVEADAFNTLRQQIGTRPIIDLSPVVNLLRDPNNALGNRVMNQLRVKYTQAPQEYGDIINLIQQPPQIQTAQGLQPVTQFTLDQAQRVKGILSKIGYEMRGTDADLAAGAKDLSHAVDSRISAGLRVNAPAGQNWARAYDTAKKVTESKVRFERMGELLQKATDQTTGEITAQSLRTQLKNIPFADLADQVGTPGAKRLHDLYNALEITGRRPGGIGKIVVAMKTGKGLSSAAEYTGGAILGYGATTGSKSAMIGGATLLASPTLLGKIMADPRLLDMMKSGKYVRPYNTPQAGPHSRAQPLQQLAAILGVDYIEAPSNPETHLPVQPGPPPPPRFEQGTPDDSFTVPAGLQKLAPFDPHEMDYLRGRMDALRPDELLDNIKQYRALRRSDSLQARE